jgi:hypothetical protein
MKAYPKVVISVAGDLSGMSPKDAEMVRMALAGAQRMINEADHEKIHRQYRSGTLGPSIGYDWMKWPEDK